MESLDERVVEEEHDGCEPPSPFLSPEDDLPNIANILDLGVAHTELPDNERCVQNHGGNEDREDEAGHQSEGGVGVWE